MASNNKFSQLVSQLHPRNRHRGRYDLDALCQALPELKPFVRNAVGGEKTIDFSNPDAVLILNRAILKSEYAVKHWSIPQGFLCPPIPGRVDYIHYLADLLAKHNPIEGTRKLAQRIPKGSAVRLLDIGTGANCIYPILGSQTYGWQFVGSEINPKAIESARSLIQQNVNLKPLIKVVHQKEPQWIFKGIIRPQDRYDVTLCNPPFHRSAEEAAAGSERKWQNLKGKPLSCNNGHKPLLNFGGQQAELCCEGGEISFLKKMLTESRVFAQQVRFFTTLVSKKENIRPLKKRLKALDARYLDVVQMTHGQKISRILIWSYQES